MNVKLVLFLDFLLIVIGLSLLLVGEYWGLVAVGNNIITSLNATYSAGQFFLFYLKLFGILILVVLQTLVLAGIIIRIIIKLMPFCMLAKIIKMFLFG